MVAGEVQEEVAGHMMMVIERNNMRKRRRELINVKRSDCDG